MRTWVVLSRNTRKTEWGASLFLVHLVLFAVPLLGADWIRVATPEAVVLTDAGEKAAQGVLHRLADLRAVFSEGFRQSARAPRLQVYVFSSEREFHSYADSNAVDGFYRSGAGYELIVLHSGAEAQRTLAHEYTHLLLKHSGDVRFPAWIEEGMAEFYSTFAVGGQRAIIGSPIAAHRATLSRENWLPAEQFYSTKAENHERPPVFYAQSWAMVHMLNLAPAYRERTAGFFATLLEGKPVPDLFREVFGRTPEQALSDLRIYVGRMSAVTVETSPTATPRPAPSERLSKLDAAIAKTELAFRTGHPEAARALLAGAARANPDSPAVEAALGLEAGFAGDRTSAVAHLERAIALGSREAWVRFELALRAREAGEPGERIHKLLAEAVSLDPDFAGARFLLGVRLTDLGDSAAAILLLEGAVRLEPRLSTYWHALGFALDKAGRRQAALEAAQKAVRTAETATEEAMASALIDALRAGL